jgi:DNA-binding LacI/PurR family transcriptional regulator
MPVEQTDDQPSQLAEGAVRACGLKIPPDTSITGFDNIEFSEFTNPALTTVNVPRRRIGEMAVEALLQEERDQNGREIVIEPEFVPRDSTGPRAAASRHLEGRPAGSLVM